MALSVAEAIAKVKEIKAQLDAGDVEEFTEELGGYTDELILDIDDADDEDDEDDDFTDDEDDFAFSDDDDD